MFADYADSTVSDLDLLLLLSMHGICCCQSNTYRLPSYRSTHFSILLVLCIYRVSRASLCLIYALVYNVYLKKLSIAMLSVHLEGIYRFKFLEIQVYFELSAFTGYIVLFMTDLCFRNDCFSFYFLQGIPFAVAKHSLVPSEEQSIVFLSPYLCLGRSFVFCVKGVFTMVKPNDAFRLL